MARSGFRRILRTTAWPAMGMVAAACILLGSCATPSGHTSPKTTSNCGGLPASTTPSIPERIVALAAQATCNQLHGLTATYQQPAEATEIIGTVSGAIPLTSSQISAAHERVKVLCFQIERALWTSTIPLQDVTVTILGPVFDDYFDQITSWYGTADLAAKAAGRVDWHGLTPDQVWPMFARALLRVDYNSFQRWDGTPGASTSPSSS